MVCNDSSNINKQDRLVNRPIGKSLRNKEFVERNSPVEDGLRNGTMTTVYCIFLSITVGHVLHTAVYYYTSNGEINFGQRLILEEFSSFFTFCYLWIPLFCSNFLIYYGFKSWATFRPNLLPKSSTLKLWDYIWLGLTIVYYPGYLYFATRCALQKELTISLRFGYYAEVTRMLMKSHAFIRSNVPRILSWKPHTECQTPCPSVSQFMYFLWAPTLIYRDSYPRTKSIRWSYVASKASEFILILLLYSAIIEMYFVYNFKDYGVKHYDWSTILVITIGNAGAGLLLMISMIYCVLDTWQNAFAEICKFADRRFYEDWWTSTDYERYYRTWNVVVHDWLYAYVYKDFYEIVAPGKKIVAKYAVFLLSAIFHEYILAFSFNFFLPIVFIQFTTPGTFMTYVKFKSYIFGNVVLLYTLSLGNSIQGTFFSLEYYARLNCPIENATLYSYFVPRMFACNGS